MTPEHRAQLRQLADRVETLKIDPGNVEQEVEGRRLGADILKALGYREGNRFLYDPAGRLLFRVPDMLNSVDDAMTVPPAGVGLYLNRYWSREGVAWSCETATGGLPDSPRRIQDVYDQPNAARAVLVAGLRARADEGEEQ